MKKYFFTLAMAAACVAVGMSSCSNDDENVAMSGTFGFELDLTKVSEEEMEVLNRETEFYNKYSGLIRNGDYYRLTFNERYVAWQFVSEDKSESLAVLVQKQSNIDFKPIIQKFEGLEPDMMYNVIIDGVKRDDLYSGIALMEIGLNVRTIKYEGTSTRIEIIAKN